MTTQKSQSPNSGQGKLVQKFKVNNAGYEWPEQVISGADIRSIAKISEEDEIYLTVNGPEEDAIIADETSVDLSNPGLEHFFSSKKGEKPLVQISVNDVERQISRGKRTVTEIKKVGHVPLAHEVEQLIKGILTPLDDNGSVVVKGGEQFFSHVRDGSSS